jgi:hypothetical protein
VRVVRGHANLLGAVLNQRHHEAASHRLVLHRRCTRYASCARRGSTPRHPVTLTTTQGACVRYRRTIDVRARIGTATSGKTRC